MLGGGQLSIGVCSDSGSWINTTIPELVIGWLFSGHVVSWAHAANDLPGGNLCFYLSYGRIVDKATRGKYMNNLVVHASDLPKGRGWSPTSWMIIEGERRIPVTLLEAVDAVDAGPIYSQEWIDLEGTELVQDWRSKLSDATMKPARSLVSKYPLSLQSAREQVGEPSHYPRRRKSDSELDINKTIADQINLLRIVDNESYPAYFRFGGKEFVVKVSHRSKRTE